MADTKTAKSEEVEEKANAVESEAQVDTSRLMQRHSKYLSLSRLR